MEQHLDTYLTTKFGLKSLVVDWIQSIFLAIQNYSSEDHDVALFAKILKNDVDEDFRLVQEEVKTTLRQCLKIEVRKAANKEYKVNENQGEYERGPMGANMRKSGSKFGSSINKGNYSSVRASSANKKLKN